MADKITWVDRVTEHPNRFRATQNDDGTLELEHDPGTVLQEGTPVSAENLNRMEKFVEEAVQGLEKIAEQCEESAEDAKTSAEEAKEAAATLPGEYLVKSADDFNEFHEHIKVPGERPAKLFNNYLVTGGGDISGSNRCASNTDHTTKKIPVYALAGSLVLLDDPEFSCMAAMYSAPEINADNLIAGTVQPYGADKRGYTVPVNGYFYFGFRNKTRDITPEEREAIRQNMTYAVTVYKTDLESGGGGGVSDVLVNGVSVLNNGVAEIPAIPQKTSELQNDADYATKQDLSKLEDVTSALISASDIVGSDLWTGEFLNGYYDAQGNFIATNNYQDCKPVDVSKYNQLTITFAPNINQAVIVGFFDKYNVGTFKTLETATSGTPYTKTLTVPGDAKTFVVSSRRTAMGTYDSWQIIGIIKNPMTDFADNLNALDERITTNESDLARIKSDVYTTTEDFVDIPLSFTNTGWYGANGVYYNSADYQYAEVPVNKGEVYDVTGRTNWDVSPYIVLDNNNNMLYTGASSGSGTTVTRSERITIPNGGVRLCFSASKNDSNWKNSCKCVKVVDVPKPIVGTNYNALKGIKWGAIGDSFTDPVTLSSQTDKRNYVDLISEQTGVNAVNLGVSGTGYKRTEENNTAFYQRANNVDADFDVITIFGSGNDQQYSAQTLVGNPTDTGTSTLAGCVNTTIDNLIARNPVVRIGIVAPTPWAGYAPFNTGATWMKRYTEMLKGVCELRGIPFLDLYHQSNLRPWDSANMSALYKDDTHPNTEGHKRIASKIKAFLIEIAG